MPEDERRDTIADLTKDFGQTIIVIFVVVFVQKLVPAISGVRFTVKADHNKIYGSAGSTGELI